MSYEMWLLLLCITLPPTVGTACSDDSYNYCATTDSCYKYYGTSDAKSWQDAENQCVHDGGHLTTIHSQAEFDDCMESMILGTGGQSSLVWIGLHYVNGDWAWISGDPQSLFTNWYSGDSRDTTRCVTAHHKNHNGILKGEWRTLRNCGASQPFVCKVSSTPATTDTMTTVVETTTTEAPDCLNMTVSKSETVSQRNEMTCIIIPQGVSHVTPVAELTLQPHCWSKVQNNSIKLKLKMSVMSSSCADLDFLFSWSNSTGCPSIKSCTNLMATGSSATECEVQCACPGTGYELRILSHNRTTSQGWTMCGVTVVDE